MSLLLLIDGYNVVAPVAPPAGNPDPQWLQRERKQLTDRLVAHLDTEIRSRTCLVFDAANPPADRPSHFEIDGIDIRFAVEYPEADDLLEELIAAHSSPKQLAVVSSDLRIQTAAKRRGSTAFEAQQWLDDLLDGKVRLATALHGGAGQGTAQRSSEKPTGTSDEEVAAWLREFGFDEP